VFDWLNESFSKDLPMVKNKAKRAAIPLSLTQIGTTLRSSSSFSFV
jgi:hypothetical protein